MAGAGTMILFYVVYILIIAGIAFVVYSFYKRIKSIDENLKKLIEMRQNEHKKEEF